MELDKEEIVVRILQVIGHLMYIYIIFSLYYYAYTYKKATDICNNNGYNITTKGRVCVFALRDCWKFEEREINVCDNIKYNAKYIINYKQIKE